MLGSDTAYPSTYPDVGYFARSESRTLLLSTPAEASASEDVGSAKVSGASLSWVSSSAAVRFSSSFAASVVDSSSSITTWPCRNDSFASFSS